MSRFGSVEPVRSQPVLSYIRLATLSSALIFGLGAAHSAFALSELQSAGKEIPVAENKDGTASPNAGGTNQPTAEKPATSVPQPEPLKSDAPKTDDSTAAPAAPVEVIYDINKAPEPVRLMRQRMVEAAASGDPERLRALITTGENGTELSLGDDEGDPIKTIKSASGDADGLEVLAIMLDVLSTGFAHVNIGTPDEAYVWPYFAEKPISSLNAPEKVELMRLVTAGDLEGMQELGNYNFFRIGIAPNGTWKYFSAGD